MDRHTLGKLQRANPRHRTTSQLNKNAPFPPSSYGSVREPSFKNVSSPQQVYRSKMRRMKVLVYCKQCSGSVLQRTSIFLYLYVIPQNTRQK